MASIPSNHYSKDLKFILERLRTPDRLDDHPWTKSLAVHDVVQRTPALEAKSPGYQLTHALAELFRQMMPSTPPQDGKRLDTRWGRFGILAANYFAPLLFGRLYPHSLLDAWRRIDQAILLFVYGEPADEFTPEQVAEYQLVGDELAFPASSTISDWHRNGLQDLADLFASREQCLSASLEQPSILTGGQNIAHPKDIPQKGARMAGAGKIIWRLAIFVIVAAVLAALGLAAGNGYGIYQLLQTVRGDMAALQALPIQSETLKQAGAVLKKTDGDLAVLKTAVTPWLPLTRRLGWVPVYGGDLQSAGDLLDTASAFTQAADQTLQTAVPIWDALHRPGDVGAPELSKMLLDTRPALLEAQAALARARSARGRIDANLLSTGTGALLRRLDPYLSEMDESLSLALAVPDLLGGTNSGPKTYLILVENEDELRPTGGLISGVAKVVVWNGQLVNLSIVDSYSVDDISKPYPPAPWQMQQYMNIPIMVFRDASWFSDYPTAVRWAEYLYAYTNSYSVDGVIAIDQHVLAALLAVTGPVYVPKISTTVTAGNVRTVMRAQKVPPPAEQADPDWQRKHFMNPIADAILQRLVSGHGISWEQLLKSMVGELDQRHILVQLDDPVLTKLLAERAWDGAVRNAGGDYLMVVDTNVGYNKTNAVLEPSMAYDLDLTRPSAPSSNLALFYRNNSRGQLGSCAEYLPATADVSLREPWYAIDRCYFGYVRVYVPAGARLSGSTPHPVTRGQMATLEKDVPARVDQLDEELAGLQAYGTLLSVPVGRTVETDLRFSLPAGIIEVDPVSKVLTYRLRIQKQPGTDDIPVTIRVHLAHGSTVTYISPEGSVVSGDNILFTMKLTTDVNIEIQFHP